MSHSPGRCSSCPSISGWMQVSAPAWQVGHGLRATMLTGLQNMMPCTAMEMRKPSWNGSTWNTSSVYILFRDVYRFDSKGGVAVHAALPALCKLLQIHLPRLDLWWSLQIQLPTYSSCEPWKSVKWPWKHPNDRERTVKFVKLSHGNSGNFLWLCGSFLKAQKKT